MQGSYRNMALHISQMTELQFHLFLRGTTSFSVAGSYSVTAGYQQIMVCMIAPDLAQSIPGTKSLTYANSMYRAKVNVLPLLHVSAWPWVCTFLTRTKPTGSIAFTAWQRSVWICHWWFCAPGLRATELSPQVWTGQTFFFARSRMGKLNHNLLKEFTRRSTDGCIQSWL